VWSIAMVFFQALLLAGYAYAHLLTRFLSSRTAVFVQIAVMVCRDHLAAAVHPGGLGPPPETGTAFWLIGLFAASIGLPFFALSANGPLLQAWFSRTEHPAAKQPLFPLRGKQYRQLPCPARLSGRDRAVCAAR